MTKSKATMTLQEADDAAIDIAVYSSLSMADLVAETRQRRSDDLDNRSSRGKSTKRSKAVTIERRAIRAMKYEVR